MLLQSLTSVAFEAVELSSLKWPPHRRISPSTQKCDVSCLQASIKDFVDFVRRLAPLNFSGARALHTRRSRCTLANTKLHVPPKTDSEATPTECGRLSTAFVMTPLLDSKTEHYISTVAHRASHSRQREVTERSENATNRKYTERVPPYSGPAAVVLSTVLRNCNNQVFGYYICKKNLHISTYSMLEEEE